MTKGAPELTWANIIGTLIFATVLAGGAAAYIREQNNTRIAELELVRSEMIRRLDRIDQALIERNEKFPTQFEFKQFQKSADDRWSTQAEINKQAVEAFLSTKAFEGWKQERDKTILDITSRLRILELGRMTPQPSRQP